MFLKDAFNLFKMLTFISENPDPLHIVWSEKGNIGEFIQILFYFAIVRRRLGVDWPWGEAIPAALAEDRAVVS